MDVMYCSSAASLVAELPLVSYLLRSQCFAQNVSCGAGVSTLCALLLSLRGYCYHQKIPASASAISHGMKISQQICADCLDAMATSCSSIPLPTLANRLQHQLLYEWDGVEGCEGLTLPTSLALEAYKYQSTAPPTFIEICDRPSSESKVLHNTLLFPLQGMDNGLRWSALNGKDTCFIVTDVASLYSWEEQSIFRLSGLGVNGLAVKGSINNKDILSCLSRAAIIVLDSLSKGDCSELCDAAMTFFVSSPNEVVSIDSVIRLKCSLYTQGKSSLHRKRYPQEDDNGDYFLRIEGVHKTTIISCGRCNFLSQELKERTARAWHVLRNAVKEDKVLPGSGVSELVCASALWSAGMMLAQSEGYEEHAAIVLSASKAIEKMARDLRNKLERVGLPITSAVPQIDFRKGSWWCHETEVTEVLKGKSPQSLDDWYSKRGAFERAFETIATECKMKDSSFSSL